MDDASVSGSHRFDPAQSHCSRACGLGEGVPGLAQRSSQVSGTKLGSKKLHFFVFCLICNFVHHFAAIYTLCLHLSQFQTSLKLLWSIKTAFFFEEVPGNRNEISNFVSLSQTQLLIVLSSPMPLQTARGVTREWRSICMGH